MKIHDILAESINDKGIFKAVFLAGTPGAGKSYVTSKITDGQINPRIVNTDKFYEFLIKKGHLEFGDEGRMIFVDRSKYLTKQQLVQYINGMLPLIVDGTSSRISNILNRNGILESFGYDTTMVWIDTNLETAIIRAKQRDRYVPEEFIREVHNRAEENKQYYINKFGSRFIEVDNNYGMLTDEVILKAYRSVSGFFSSEIDNPVGRRNVERLQEAGEVYLVPTLYEMDQLHRIVDVWYRKK